MSSHSRIVAIRAVSLFLSLTLLPSTVWSQSTRRNIEVDDLFRLKRVGSPRISPDGKWIAYTVSETDLKEDESETAVWMAPADGGEAIRMTAKGSSAGSPRWSPDGKYLSFQGSRNESKSQVWLLNRLGGEAQQLTKVKQGIRSHRWSPDGTKLLLTIQDPKPEDADKEKEDDDKKDKEKPKPWVIDRLQFKRDNIGYLDRRRSHLYVFDMADRTLKQITSGDFDDSDGAWSPDGKLVAFSSKRTGDPDSNANSDIWIVSADNSDKGKTLRRVTTNEGSDDSPAWSPDGRSIAYVTVIEPDYLWYATNHLAVVSSDGGEPRLLNQSLDRNASSPRFSADGNSVFFVLEDSGERHLARIGVDGQGLIRPIDGHLSLRAYHEVNGRIAALISRPHLPSEVFSYRQGELTQVSKTNEEFLSKVHLAAVENVQFPSRDGTEIEGFIFKPPDFNDKLRYPTLLRIHGGPVSQYDFSFKFDAQLFAANGYVVVMTNPRGSSGYGQAFSMGIFRSWGVKDFEDVMAGIDHAIELGYSDPDRLGVGGWSYGGILTNYVITQTDRFEGAISGASEVLYVANYGHDHYQYWWEKELGLPWENRQLWEKLSPFNSVEKIVTPTLIMCGEKDWNVPVLNSEQLYQALRRLGRTTQLVVYPGEHHGIRRPSFQKDRLERYLAWYDKYVKGEAVVAPAGH